MSRNLLSHPGVVNKSQEKRSAVIRRDSGYLSEAKPIAEIPSELTTFSIYAEDRSNFNSVPSSDRKISLSPSSSNSQMRTRIIRGLRNSMFFSDTRISEADLLHFRSSFRPSLSSSELIFLQTVSEQGLRRAAFLAAIFHWQHRRPLQALLAAMHGCVRSYTKRSATRKRPSNSPAASKKRS